MSETQEWPRSSTCRHHFQGQPLRQAGTVTPASACTATTGAAPVPADRYFSRRWSTATRGRRMPQTDRQIDRLWTEVSSECGKKRVFAWAKSNDMFSAAVTRGEQKEMTNTALHPFSEGVNKKNTLARPVGIRPHYPMLHYTMNV